MPATLALMAITVDNPASGLFSSYFGDNPTVQGIIQKIINVLLEFAGVIAILFIIIGGYQYLTSGFNPKQAEDGKKTLQSAIIGIAIIILSYTIISVVFDTISK